MAHKVSEKPTITPPGLRDSPGPWLKQESPRKGPKGGTKTSGGDQSDSRHSGKLKAGRLDKKARGGAVQKFQLGGGVGAFHKLTPSKHKPHSGVSVNVIHNDLRRGNRPIRPLVPPGIAPIGPVGGLPMPPMKPPGMRRGGRTGGAGSGLGRLNRLASSAINGK
jgi:hypothetical protein